jgi:predicted secreted protein
MATTTAIAIYFILWWTVLFAVLPFGVRSQHESGSIAPGTDPGAPVLARVWMKLLWTTVVTSVIFAIMAVLYSYRLIPFEDIARWFGPTTR